MMTSPRSDRKNKIEKIRRGRLALFDKADKLGMIGANVYVVVEINGKYFIYNSQPDKGWPPSDAILVCWTHHTIFNKKNFANLEKERYYPLPERNTPDDIRQRTEKCSFNIDPAHLHLSYGCCTQDDETDQYPFTEACRRDQRHPQQPPQSC
jgi:hypothetical protein